MRRNYCSIHGKSERGDLQTIFSDYMYNQREIEVIIVLGNLMKKDGTLNHESAARVRCAAHIAAQRNPCLIITCGWAYRGDSSITIAEAMKSHIKTHYPEVKSPIICQKASRDTVGDAVFTKLVVERIANIEDVRITAVTSDYHACRTQEIFDFVFGKTCDCIAAPSKRAKQIKRSELNSLKAFRNTFVGIRAGETEQIVGTMSELHPFYNGDRHSKIGNLNHFLMNL